MRDRLRINPQPYPTDNFAVRHVIGIDMSPICAARTGVRGDNDLVWVGRAANYAAKLTSLPNDTPTWITADMFNAIHSAFKIFEGKAVWQPKTWTQMNNHLVYCSNWYWGFN